jgi:ubiquinone/menaquinone biosynthesis C-methylase UbiE
MPTVHDRSDKLERYWDKQAGSYDTQMRFLDRRVFGDTRAWVCSRASGQVLEVAVGTGLNLPHYPADVQLTGLDLSEELLAIARSRAAESGRSVTFVHGNAQALPFEDAAFDTVVCTFGLCSIPDLDAAVGEMHRVLRSGGRLLLADHIASSSRPARVMQWLVERITIPMAEEHYRRRPLDHLPAAGFTVDAAERFTLGIVERLEAHKAVSRSTRRLGC